MASKVRGGIFSFFLFLNRRDLSMLRRRNWGRKPMKDRGKRGLKMEVVLLGGQR